MSQERHLTAADQPLAPNRDHLEYEVKRLESQIFQGELALHKAIENLQTLKRNVEITRNLLAKLSARKESPTSS